MKGRTARDTTTVVLIEEDRSSLFRRIHLAPVPKLRPMTEEQVTHSPHDANRILQSALK